MSIAQVRGADDQVVTGAARHRRALACPLAHHERAQTYFPDGTESDNTTQLLRRWERGYTGGRLTSVPCREL